MNLKPGDRVRYIGTAEQDIYHGLCVGREGMLVRYAKKLWLESQGKLWSVDLALVSRLHRAL